VVTTITTRAQPHGRRGPSIAAEKSSAILQDIANEAFKESIEHSADDLCPQGESIIVYLRRDLDFLRLLRRSGPAGDDAAEARRPNPAQCRPDALLSDRAGLQMKQFPFLDKALERLKPFLSDERVSEISVNRPGELFVERLGVGHGAGRR
jgi:hypothetical protein